MPSAYIGDVTTLLSGAAGEPAGAWLSDVVVAVAVAERNVRGAFGHFAVPGRRSRPSDRHPRPSYRYVREETGKETCRPVHSGRKAASRAAGFEA